MSGPEETREEAYRRHNRQFWKNMDEDWLEFMRVKLNAETPSAPQIPPDWIGYEPQRDVALGLGRSNWRHSLGISEQSASHNAPGSTQKQDG